MEGAVLGGKLAAEVVANRYEWLDADRVRIWYTFTNKGTTTITSWKAVVGFDGKTPTNWNRTQTVLPGKSFSSGSVFPSTMYGTLPNTWRMRVTELNGLPDANPSNNETSIVVSK